MEWKWFVDFVESLNLIPKFEIVSGSDSAG